MQTGQKVGVVEDMWNAGRLRNVPRGTPEESSVYTFHVEHPGRRPLCKTRHRPPGFSPKNQECSTWNTRQDSDKGRFGGGAVASMPAKPNVPRGTFRTAARPTRIPSRAGRMFHVEHPEAPECYTWNTRGRIKPKYDPAGCFRGRDSRAGTLEAPNVPRGTSQDPTSVTRGTPEKIKAKGHLGGSFPGRLTGAGGLEVVECSTWNTRENRPFALRGGTGIPSTGREPRPEGRDVPRGTSRAPECYT
jgi:hypothetical protein